MNEPTGREPWPQRMMRLAQFWAEYGTCAWLRVGAVVVDSDFQVLVSGFNGSPRGQPHCNEGRVERLGHCVRCIHAEMNCIIQAARTGTSIRGGMLFTTTRPCIRCALAIAQVGLSKVWYRDEYDSDHQRDQVFALLRSSGVSIARTA